jgi:hypothetical protein
MAERKTEPDYAVMSDEELDAVVKAELEASLDAYQADLEAALLKKPFPKGGPKPLDLTPPDENEGDVFGDD